MKQSNGGWLSSQQHCLTCRTDELGDSLTLLSTLGMGRGLCIFGTSAGCEWAMVATAHYASLSAAAPLCVRHRLQVSALLQRPFTEQFIKEANVPPDKMDSAEVSRVAHDNRRGRRGEEGQGGKVRGRERGRGNGRERLLAEQFIKEADVPPDKMDSAEVCDVVQGARGDEGIAEGER